MKTNIEFFKKCFIDAIGAGVYKIVIRYHNKEKILYIGESVFVLVRCAAHLFELKKNPNYLGFTDKSIQNEDITLNFEILESCGKTRERKELEKLYIKDYSPIMQSGISDRMKSIEEKLEVLTGFLND